MRGPTLTDEYHAVVARLDEVLGERDRLAEDNEQLRGERDQMLALLRRCYGWFKEGPDCEEPEPLTRDIAAVLEAQP